MIDRRGLLKTAALVYLVLTVVAVGLAWLTQVDLGSLMRFDGTGALLGLTAVLPMSVVFFVAPDLKDRVVDLLGPALAQCRWYDLVALAAMAGIAEELVFRGALEGWLRSYDILFAVVVANLLFGAMHPITVTYFLIAAGFGVYFSVLANLGSERNLTAPIVAHTVYDLIGFLLVARDFRKTSSGFVAPSRWPPAQTTTQPATTEPAIQDSGDEETPEDGTRPETDPHDD